MNTAPTHTALPGSTLTPPDAPTDAAPAVDTSAPAESTTSPVPAYGSAFFIPFMQVREEFAALDPSELVQLSLDVTAATITALGALPAIHAMRDQIAILPLIDMERVDKLETYTRAAHYAQCIYYSTSQPEDGLPAALERGTKLRAMMMSAVESASHKALLDRNVLKRLRKGSGYRDVAIDLVALVALFNSSWPAVEGRTVVDLEDLAEADQLAHRIIVGVGTREQTIVSQTQAASDRHRAVTLFVRAYNHVRRAIAFLRWEEGDADLIAPPLYNRPRTRRRKKLDEPAQPATPAAPSSPVNPVIVAKPSPEGGATASRPVGQSDPFGRK